MLPVLSRSNVLVPLIRSWEKRAFGGHSWPQQTKGNWCGWSTNWCVPHSYIYHVVACFSLRVHFFSNNVRALSTAALQVKECSFSTFFVNKLRSQPYLLWNRPHIYIVTTFMDNLVLSLQFVNNNWYFKNRRSSWLSSVSSHGISMSNVFGVSGANKLWSSLLSGLEQSE